ncbi:hypothetical protein U1Q18_033835 [Sarracenia purpurea var. burkii]
MSGMTRIMEVAKVTLPVSVHFWGVKLVAALHSGCEWQWSMRMFWGGVRPLWLCVSGVKLPRLLGGSVASWMWRKASEGGLLSIYGQCEERVTGSEVADGGAYQ